MTSGWIRSARTWLGRPWNSRATQTYVTVVATIGLWVHTANARLASAALRTASTNLDRLGRDPVSVVIVSAFWIEPNGWRTVATLLIMSLVIFAPLEARIGTWRWVAVFAAGHIGSTLVVAAGLTIGIRAGRIDPAVSRTIDVGWSYGGMALVAALTFHLHQRYRWLYSGLVVAQRVALLRTPTFTEWGHLSSVAIGLGVGYLLTVRLPHTMPGLPAAISSQGQGRS